MTTRGDACWHCGEPLPATVLIHARIAGQSRPMCCHGCRAAAEWIEQLGLGDYYRLRTRPAQKRDLNAGAGHRDRDGWRRGNHPYGCGIWPGCREAMLLIEGVRCAGCVWLIERAIGALPRRNQHPGQCSSSARSSDLARRDDYVAADPAASRADRLSRIPA